MDIVTKIKGFESRAQEDLQNFFDRMLEENEMYSSRQWLGADREKLENEDKACMTVNFIKKMIDSVSGNERQNRYDMRIEPEETNDELLAEILNKSYKWVYNNGGFSEENSLAYKNAAITGLGWLFADISFEDDFVSGDVVLRAISPFELLFDPNTKFKNFKDSEFFIYKKSLHKDLAKRKWSKHSEAIDNAANKKFNTNYVVQNVVPEKRKDHVEVVECWYKDYVKKTIIANNQEDFIVFDGSKEELENKIINEGYYEVGKREVAVYRRAFLLEGDTLLSDEATNLKRFPFFPIVGYLNPFLDDWELKVQGLIRPLVDVQREKNKKRSLLMDALNNSIREGWTVEKGAVDDLKNLDKRVTEKNPNRLIQRKEPPSVDMGLIQSESTLDQDMNLIGVNQYMQGTDMGQQTAGITVQLRQKQAIVALEELSDNYKDALKDVCEFVLDLMLQNFTEVKFRKILGRNFPFPNNFDFLRDTFKYNCEVIEGAYSQTSRMASLIALTQYQQSGGQIPAGLILELSDINKTEKDKLRKIEEQSRQMEAQRLQVEQQRLQQSLQVEQMKVASKEKLELEKLQLDKLKIEADLRMKQMEHQKEMKVLQTKLVDANIDLMGTRNETA